MINEKSRLWLIQKYICYHPFCRHTKLRLQIYFCCLQCFFFGNPAFFLHLCFQTFFFLLPLLSRFLRGCSLRNSIIPRIIKIYDLQQLFIRQRTVRKVKKTSIWIVAERIIWYLSNTVCISDRLLRKSSILIGFLHLLHAFYLLFRVFSGKTVCLCIVLALHHLINCFQLLLWYILQTIFYKMPKPRLTRDNCSCDQYKSGSCRNCLM